MNQKILNEVYRVKSLMSLNENILKDVDNLTNIIKRLKNERAVSKQTRAIAEAINAYFVDSKVLKDVNINNLLKSANAQKIINDLKRIFQDTSPEYSILSRLERDLQGKQIGQVINRVKGNVNNLKPKKLTKVEQLLNYKPIATKLRDVIASHTKDWQRMILTWTGNLDKYVENIYSHLLDVVQTLLNEKRYDETTLRAINTEMKLLEDKYKIDMSILYDDLKDGLKTLKDSKGNQLLTPRQIQDIIKELEKTAPWASKEKTQLESFWETTYGAKMIGGIGIKKSERVTKLFNITERTLAFLFTGYLRKFREYYPWLRTVKGSVKFYFWLLFCKYVIYQSVITLGIMMLMGSSHALGLESPENIKFTEKFKQILKSKWENLIFDEEGGFNVSSFLPFEYIWGDIMKGWEGVMGNQFTLTDYILSKRDKYNIRMKQQYDEFIKKHPQYSKDDYEKLKELYPDLESIKKIKPQKTPQPTQNKPTPPQQPTQNKPTPPQQTDIDKMNDIFK
jgi:hypothetical protein